MREGRHVGAAPIWGVSAEFAAPQAMLAALTALSSRGLGRLDTFSPVPIAEVEVALGYSDRLIRLAGIAAAVLGFAAMMGMCIYATAYDYVFIVGGRPLVSWQSFIVPSVSFAMLCGSLVAFLAMMVLNRMPRINHPAFNIPNFARASQDRFFLAVEAGDDFDPASVEQALLALPQQPIRIHRVPR